MLFGRTHLYKNHSRKVLFITICIAALFTSCENDEHGDEVLISSFNSSESHNGGKNCMDCHISGGDGEGWFFAAGTIFDSTGTSPFPNATVSFFDNANRNGTPLKIVEGDLLGNFYTTEKIGSGSNLYVSVKGAIETQQMSAPVSSGQCNSCHGSSVDPIHAR